MSNSVPPNPEFFGNMRDWARAFYEFQLTQTRIGQANDPLPVLLAHRTGGIVERAATDGVLMYDPTYETPIISIDDAWEPTRTKPQFLIDYDTPAATDGAAMSAGANAIPFDVAEVDVAAWATFNATTNDFTLIQGRYYVSGFVSLSKVSGGAKAFTGYLAETSALTTPVGDVKMGTLVIPSSASNDETHVVPFQGIVDVPDGGGTYSMVVHASAADCRFGTAHGITGYTNIFGRLAVTLIGVNGA